MNEQERLKTINQFIECIASCGRKFFRHDEKVSRFEVDSRGRVWFIDKYTQKRIYTHYRYDWRGFTEGGTLRRLAEQMRDYIKTGKPLFRRNFYFPTWMCDGDVWGYGADMNIVRAKANELNLIETAD